MAIRIQCPSPECGARCSAADTVSGRTVKCPKCGKAFVAQATLDGETSDTKRSRPGASGDPFPALPAEFGRYRILKLLGRGGMGAVYLAHDSELGRDVAIKIPFIDASKSQRIERFAREARAAAGLKHPNICTVFDTGRIGGRPFITMEYIVGTPLEHEIGSNGLMPQPRAAEIVRKVALALEFAHQKGTVHRDLKPANIMMGADGEPMVMDFGLAKQVADADPNASRLTADGGILGTPTYMSPEQVKGDAAAIGPASDVYALGVVLFEMLTGTPPYTGAVGMVMAQIISSPVPEARESRRDVDPQLDAICQRAMAKEPGRRFRSMAEFADALARYSTAPIAATPPAPRRVETAAAEEVDVELVDVRSPRPKPVADVKRATKRKAPRWMPFALVALALAILVPFGVWLAGIVLRVETPNGTLVVEINDPNVEARIKNGKLVLSGPDGKDIYTLAPGERDKKLDAGAYKIRVEGADGLVLDTTEFTLKKGDKVTVKVTVDPKAVAKKDPPAVKKDAPILDPDRKAAEYVLSIGGTVRIDSQDRDLKAVADLPRVPFRLTYVHLGHNSKVNDADLAIFKGCTNLTDLSLISTAVTDAGVEHFRGCKNLKKLDLAFTTVTGESLSHFKNLVDVVMARTRLSDAGMVHLKDCKGLIRIHFGFTDIGDAGMAQIKDCTALTIVVIEGSRVTDAGVAHLKGCKDLELLAANLTSVGDDTLAFLKDFKKLSSLRVSLTKISDDGLAHLKGYKSLQDIELGDDKLTDAGLIHLKECKSLTVLTLNNNPVSDAGVAHLKNCNGLTMLRIHATKITAAGVAELRKALPACGVEWDGVKEPAPIVAADGFVPLFNGKDLSGWVVDGACKEEEWKADANGITIAGGPAATWGSLLSKKEYTNFVLRLQFQQLAEGAKSGIVVRGIPGQRSTNLPYQFKVNLQAPDSTGAVLWSSNSVYQKPAIPAKLKPARDWNDLEVELSGQKLQVTVNGVRVQTMDLDAFAGKPTALAALKNASGRIGLQKVNGDVSFRRIEIKELPSDPFQEGSVWVSFENKVDMTLTVIERKGEKFKARFLVGGVIDREVSGTVKGGKVTWLEKDVKASKGSPGSDNVGTFRSDKDGDVLDFVFGPLGLPTNTGTFKLRLKQGK